MSKAFDRSPLLQEFLAEHLYEALEEMLRARFRRIPGDVRRDLRAILNARTLKKLCRVAAACERVAAFHWELRTQITNQTAVVRLLEM